MPEGKEKLCAGCALATDGPWAGQLKIRVFELFLVGRELARELLANTR
jgi:hypothetical protein